MVEEEPTEETTDSYEEEDAVLRSTEGIKKYVQQNLPLAVREKISSEAWDDIFEGIESQLEDNGMEAREGKDPTIPIKFVAGSRAEDEDDIMSAISELSFSSAPQRQRVESRTRASIAQEHLEACLRHVSSDRWAAFETIDSKSSESDHGIDMPARLDAFGVALPPTKPIRQTSSPNIATELVRPGRWSGTSPPPQPTRRTSFSQNNSQSTGTRPIRIPQRQLTNDPQQVAFGTVQARFYEPVAEVNPSVSSGVAVGIGWMYTAGKVISVDQWELEKDGLVRRGHELVLPRRVREHRLLDAGFTQMDIAQATRTVLKIKHQRKATIESLAVQQYAEEMMERAKRRIQMFLKIDWSSRP